MGRNFRQNLTLGEHPSPVTDRGFENTEHTQKEETEALIQKYFLGYKQDVRS